MIGVKGGDGEGARGVIDGQGLTYLDADKEGSVRVKVRVVLEEEGFGEKGGVNGGGEVGSDAGGMVLVGVGEEVVPLR